MTNTKLDNSHATAEGHPIAPPLSPAAQAVRSAYHEICEDYIETWLNFNHNRGLAAVLRAAADRVVPQCDQPLYADDFTHGAWFARDDVRDDLLRIANELESLTE